MGTTFLWMCILMRHTYLVGETTLLVLEVYLMYAIGPLSLKRA